MNKADFFLGSLIFASGFILAMASNELFEIVTYEDIVNDEVAVYQDDQTAYANYYFNHSGNNSYGFFNHAGYFCVTTLNREPEEIARTTFHELSHYFVSEDKNHFLGVEN